MRKLMLLLTALALGGASPAAAEPVTVAITKTGFVPKAAAIQVGENVTWTNSDTMNRQVISQAAGFASPILKPGETYTFTYTRAGSFRYQSPNTNQTGTVVVEKGPNPVPRKRAATVTLAASRGIVIFGGSVRMSGTVSSGKAGETVSIVSQPQGEPASRTDLTTTTGGTWVLAVRPQILTTYRAEWDTGKSSDVVLRVRPRVSLRKVALNRFATSVVATGSHAGKVVQLKRWSTVLRRWLLVKRVTLRQSTVDENVAVVTFRAKLRKNRKLRMFLPQSQVLPGYVAGYSSFIVT